MGLVVKVKNRAISPATSMTGSDERSKFYCGRIFILLAKYGVQCGKKQNAGSQSPEKKIKRYMPVPYIQLGIYKVVHSAAYDDLFSHAMIITILFTG
jgi:hypothetical protein